MEKGNPQIKENIFVKYENGNAKQTKDDGCGYCTFKFGDHSCCSDQGCCTQK